MNLNTFYTIAPVLPTDMDFSWLPVIDDQPKPSEDSSQITLEVIQCDAGNRTRFTISTVGRKDFLVLEIWHDNFIEACRVYVSAVHAHMQTIAAGVVVVVEI